MEFRPNKKLAKRLIKASVNRAITAIRLNWLIENKEAILGCVRPRLFGQDIFIIVKNKDEYRLYCSCGRETRVYLIWDIEGFLKLVGVDELQIPDGTDLSHDLQVIRETYLHGIIFTTDEEIFFQDFHLRD